MIGRPWRLLERKRAHVVLKNGETLRGIVWRRRGPLIVLRETELLTSNSQTAIDGEVVIERSNVAYYQVLPVEAGGA